MNVEKILFVGRLSSKTDEKSLETYFSQWGKVVDSNCRRNYNYAFITFSSFYGKHPLDQKQHFIDGKQVKRFKVDAFANLSFDS